MNRRGFLRPLAAAFLGIASLPLAAFAGSPVNELVWPKDLLGWLRSRGGDDLTLDTLLVTIRHHLTSPGSLAVRSRALARGSSNELLLYGNPSDPTMQEILKDGELVIRVRRLCQRANIDMTRNSSRLVSIDCTFNPQAQT